MYWSDDPARDAERYIADLDKQLERRPVCDCCGEHIQDEMVLHYKGIWLCEDCMDNHREYVESEVYDEEF